MNNKDKEMLTIYRNLSAYTAKAIEKAIESLNESISKRKANDETIDIIKERRESLEEYLIKIELDF